MDKAEKVILIFMIFVLAGIFYSMYIGNSDCIESGGDYVRGLFWFKCI